MKNNQKQIIVPKKKINFDETNTLDQMSNSDNQINLLEMEKENDTNSDSSKI